MKETRSLIKGALIGSAIGGVIGLLIAPKPGARLIQDIIDSYESVHKNGHYLIETLKKKSHSFTHPFEDEEEEDDEENHTSFLVGGAIGAVVAAIAALLLAPESGKKLRQMLGSRYDDIREKAEAVVANVAAKGEHVLDEANDWKETLTDLIGRLPNSGKGRRKQLNGINRIVDLAHLGMRL
jgi:gas vesicle protein